LSITYQQELEGPPSPQICGRCRVLFPGDATLPQGLDTGTWYCAPCHERLLGTGAMAIPTWPAKAPR